MTLQEQYNRIQKGKGSKEIFLKEAKSKYPNLVRNAAGFDETSSILKKRNIIAENIYLATGKTEKPDWFDIFNENMDAINEEAKAVEKKPTKEVVDMETKGYDYKDLKNIDNVFGESFLKGYYTEMKNPKNADKTIDEVKEIVAKNLAKDRLYYVKEAQFGVEGIGYTDETPGLKASKTDQMEEVKLNENEIIKVRREREEERKKEAIGLANDIGLKGSDAQNFINKLMKATKGKSWDQFYDIADNIMPQFMGERNENKMIKLVDLIKESYDEFQRDDKGAKDVDKRNKGEEDAFGAGVEKGEKIEKKKLKKETTESKLAEIEKQGKINTLEAQINALEEIIEGKSSRINMVQEDENMSELVDKKKVKEMQREIKLLEKRKMKLMKEYKKMSGKDYRRVMEEDSLEEESNGNSNLGSNENSNSNSNTNPDSYSGLDKFKPK